MGDLMKTLKDTTGDILQKANIETIVRYMYNANMEETEERDTKAMKSMGTTSNTGGREETVQKKLKIDHKTFPSLPELIETGPTDVIDWVGQIHYYLLTSTKTFGTPINTHWSFY